MQFNFYDCHCLRDDIIKKFFAYKFLIKLIAQNKIFSNKFQCFKQSEYNWFKNILTDGLYSELQLI